MASDAEHLFICLWALCMSSFGKCLLKSFAHLLIALFVFQEWNHVSSWYILEIRPFSEVSLANMLSYTVGSLCNLVLFSLAMQKLFILMKSHFLILSFMSLALGDISLRMLLFGMSEIFLPKFSSRTFMALGFIFCWGALTQPPSPPLKKNKTTKIWSAWGGEVADLSKEKGPEPFSPWDFIRFIHTGIQIKLINHC